MAIRLQIEKIELLDHGRGVRPGTTPVQAGVQTENIVVVPELANAPTIESESPETLARTEEIVARAKVGAKK